MKDRTIKRWLNGFSTRTLLVMAVDVLLMSISFFLTFVYLNSTHKIICGPVNYYLALAIYDVLLFLAVVMCGGYAEKNLSNVYSSVLCIIWAVFISHIVGYLVFDYCNVNLGFGLVSMGAFSAVLLVVGRILQNKVYKHFKQHYKDFDNRIPTLIIGAGFTGKMVFRELQEAPEFNLVPVCFVDDNKDLISKEICGINVYGPTVLIPKLCEKYNIGMIIFAIPSCPQEERTRILSNCQELNCAVRIIPSLNELTNERNFFKQARSVDVEKLLGRDAISIENTRLEALVKDKSCLVTGGGGSIGSELCRQIVKVHPKRLVILDIYENNAYEIQQQLKRAGYNDDVVSVEIASVRDINKMRLIFQKYNFDLVFHAAAHKHVPLMEDNPEEAIKNNVCGTYNVAHLSHQFGVETMVLISTDKAVNPTNVMGASKRVCEMVMQYMAQRYPKTKFTAVRFGNVLGSNGSVIPLFTKQIESGGPVTVTHPDIIRYFMTIPEAVSLVLEAATMSQGGETFVLDMGEPVKIVTLAENLIKMYGYKPYEEMPIEFCGLRAGEKLFEELLMDEENLKKTYNKKIFISNQLPVDCDAFKSNLDRLIQVSKQNASDQTVALLHSVVPTYQNADDVNEEAEQHSSVERTPVNA